MKPTIIQFFLGLILITASCNSEKKNSSQNITSNKIHNSNIGKIRFLSKAIPNKETKETDFLTSFELNKTPNLTFRAFLEKPLVEYLQALAPDSSASQLCKMGNYQFSFYLNNKLIYTENLNNAGTPTTKSTEITLTKPLISNRKEDSWGRFLWMRFWYMGGGAYALEEGNNNLKIEIRPYIEKPNLKIGKIIAEGQINISVQKPMVDEKVIAFQHIQPNKEWELSIDNIDTLKIRKLNEKIAQNDFKDITSIVVIRNSKLLLEEYFNGASRSTLHNTRSVGKSFASTIMGIAIKEGHIKNENAKLGEFYDLKTHNNYSPKKENITLKSLLTMSSGLLASDENPDSPGNKEKMYVSPNWVKFTLDLPMDCTKVVGKNLEYISAGTILIGDILNKSVPKGLEKYTHKKLFKPLHIQNYKWQYTPQNTPNTAGNLQMNSLDYAKYGQLYKNEGFWNGKQLIDKDWVRASLAKQISMVRGSEKRNYGYFFWNKNYAVNNKQYEVSYAAGNGGNNIFIFKHLPVVIVITATAYNELYDSFQVDKIIENFLLPAIIKEKNI